MPVKFGNKDYRTVAERLVLFFGDKYKDLRIVTKVIHQDDVRVVMRAEIRDCSKPGEFGEYMTVSSGTASIERGSNSFTSKDTEKCETTAVGRALAFLSEELMGSDIASADEVAASISEGAGKDLIAYNELLREDDVWDAVVLAKRYLLPTHGPDNIQSNVTAAREALKELGDDKYMKLWRAPSKGGIFTTHERKILKEKPEDAL